MTSTQYEAHTTGTKVAVRQGMLVNGAPRVRVNGKGLVTGFTYWNGEGGTPEANRTGGWYTVEMTTGTYKGEQVTASSHNVNLPAAAKPTTHHRAQVDKPAAETLPRIVRFIGIDDAGEFGNATCPHCGALGRYTHRFEVEDGTILGAMAGCVQRFPVSPEAKRQGRR